MANIKLGSSEIKQLLATYESKQKQLLFELSQTKSTLRDLRAVLPAIEQAETAQMEALTSVENAASNIEIPTVTAAPAKAKGKRGRKPGSTKKALAAKAEKGTAAKAEKAPRKKTKKNRATGYRLSEYDELVYKALETTSHAMINSEIVDFIEADKKAQGDNTDADTIQTMVVRSLQKLANRREDIKKVAYEGRGMAYALPAWVNNKGVIKRKYARKG